MHFRTRYYPLQELSPGSIIEAYTSSNRGHFKIGYPLYTKKDLTQPGNKTTIVLLTIIDVVNRIEGWEGYTLCTTAELGPAHCYHEDEFKLVAYPSTS